MCVPPEIITLFFLISFLIYTMPMVLVKFSKTPKGKFLLLLLTIVMTLYNRTGGLLLAMLFIFLAEFNYEFNTAILYEGFVSTMDVYNEKIDQLQVAEKLKPKPSATIVADKK
jgi:hypothetical protein